MNIKILILLFGVLFVNYSSEQEVIDPLQGLRDLGEKLDASARNFVQGINDKLKPLLKGLRKVDKKVFGGLNNAVFNVEKGIVEGLNEVIGIPVNIGDVEFFLATSENYNDPMKIDYQNPSAVATSRGKIFFIIHGWMSSRNTSWYPRLTEILLNKFPHSHVVMLDWHKPAADEYPLSAFKTESVGNLVAILIKRLITDFNVPLEHITLIGHSLGGQICGWAGKKIKELTSEKLRRIIALDPAGPLFSSRPDSKRLNKHDANVVMVIHSDGGKLGFPFSCGTIDFYPNGGALQPGCAKIDPTDIQKIFDPLSCNHFRAYEYFMEALNSTGTFRARKCASYTHFRLNQQCEDVEVSLGDLKEDARGSFYLETAGASPFSLPLKPLFGYVDIVDIAGGTAGSGSQTILSNGQMAQNGDIIIDVKDGDGVNSITYVRK